MEFKMKKSYEQISIQVDSDLVKKIDTMAKKLNLSRSTLARNLLASGYEDAAMVDKIGLLTAFQYGQKLTKAIKEGIAKGKIRFTDGKLKIDDE
jgi:predicted transcriptional regulator